MPAESPKIPTETDARHGNEWCPLFEKMTTAIENFDFFGVHPLRCFDPLIEQGVKLLRSTRDFEVEHEVEVDRRPQVRELTEWCREAIRKVKLRIPAKSAEDARKRADEHIDELIQARLEGNFRNGCIAARWTHCRVAETIAHDSNNPRYFYLLRRASAHLKETVLSLEGRPGEGVFLENIKDRLTRIDELFVAVRARQEAEHFGKEIMQKRGTPACLCDSFIHSRSDVWRANVARVFQKNC